MPNSRFGDRRLRRRLGRGALRRSRRNLLPPAVAGLNIRVIAQRIAAVVPGLRGLRLSHGRVVVVWDSAVGVHIRVHVGVIGVRIGVIEIRIPRPPEIEAQTRAPPIPPRAPIPVPVAAPMPATAAMPATGGWTASMPTTGGRTAALASVRRRWGFLCERHSSHQQADGDDARD